LFDEARETSAFSEPLCAGAGCLRAIGETVEVFGVARDGTSLSICPGSEYYVRVMG
jgi:hypothetical protein